MGDSDWESHKTEIEQLYLKENKTLEDVLRFLETTYGFRKKKHQYAAQLKKWGFKKYRMGVPKWRHVNRKVQEREAEVQNLEVWMNGIFYPQKTVQFEIYRQGFQREIEKYRRGEAIQKVGHEQARHENINMPKNNYLRPPKGLLSAPLIPRSYRLNGR